jgi:pyrroline-5-carboxylate reductase
MSDSSLSDKRLGLVGGGKMAEALARSVISAGLVDPSNVCMFDPEQERRRIFEELGTGIAADNPSVLSVSDIVVLAVKPQTMAVALEQCAPSVKAEHLFISIAAGIRTSIIENAFPGTARVVRVMPNTPMQIGHGAAALAPGASARDADMAIAETLFAASGIAVRVQEIALDAVTAVSGSGPAYAFFLAECMMEAGIAEGLPPDLARELASATIEGAGRYLSLSSTDAAELRRRVTSPGGTTQAAFEVLGDAGTRDALVRAIRRAAERSRELSEA